LNRIRRIRRDKALNINALAKWRTGRDIWIAMNKCRRRIIVADIYRDVKRVEYPLKRRLIGSASSPLAQPAHLYRRNRRIRIITGNLQVRHFHADSRRRKCNVHILRTARRDGKRSHVWVE
jgi:hypothetical protein